ncbi:MAG: hypothetical protein IJ678_03775 [Kiritimatiellae bacterium]|nr:hypothetical protein [Kiritimatiellia bacterium]
MKQLGPFGKMVGASQSFDNKQHQEIVNHLKNYARSHPCEPLVIIGHSYGGDTAMDVAAELGDLPCSCIFVVTLDPVSHFDPDTWLGSSPKTGNIDEWTNVYQPTGIEDVIFDIPVVGWLLGGIWSGLGVPARNNNMVASGGGQWNYESDADLNIPAIDPDGRTIDHHGVDQMMNVPFVDENGTLTTVRQHVNELSKRNCCE